MSRKVICFALSLLFFAPCASVEAQQQAKVPKIGWLASGSVATLGPGAELFRREFRALGYVEGKNVTFEYRYADNKPDRLPALADELVRLTVDVVVTANEQCVGRKGGD